MPVMAVLYNLSSRVPGEARLEGYDLANFVKHGLCQMLSSPFSMIRSVSEANSTGSEYLRELIRKDQDRQHLRGLLLAGAESGPIAPADGDYFESLRAKVVKTQG